MKADSVRVFPTLSFLPLVALVLAFSSVRCLGNPLNADIHLGRWVWAAETHDRQECRFVRALEIPAGASVRSARLRITADNSYELFLDGQEIGRGGDWRSLIEYDVKLFLTPGEHVFAVKTLNDFDVAGLIFGLKIEMVNGRVMEIASDDSWKVAPNSETLWKYRSSAWETWPAATVLSSFPGATPKAVYYAPASRPVEISLWQRRWFQNSIVVLIGMSLLSGLFLASRLILQSRMDAVIRRERARIALDLHDGLGGELTQLVLFSDSSSRNLASGSPEATMLGGLCEKSRSLVREMNEAVWLINSQRDTLRDLASYVVKYAESLFQNSSIRCRFDIDEQLPQLPCDLGVRRNIFLAVKEALNNVLRHSRASVAEVAVRRSRNELIIAIRDNGTGFVPSSRNSGNGLGSMWLRVTETGGDFRLDSEPGRGCTVRLRIPLRKPSNLAFARLVHWIRSAGKA